MAQSNATGNIIGKIAPDASASVQIVGSDNGFKRTISPDASGTFRITSLPVGNYKVTLLKGSSVVSTQDVEVRIGQESEVALQQVQTVNVTSRRRSIDVTSSNSGSSFNSRELATLPLAPTVANIVQLAGGTTRADSRYGNNAASFGGSSASENAAYINGFPVTNSLYQVGYSSLPFGSIAEAQIITGGYGAEFGRSTGGVVNITTKSGTNNWEFGAGFTYAPDSLRGKAKNIMFPNTGANPKTDGKIYNYREGDKLTEKVYNAYVSGPLIKDKLFIYLGGEFTKMDRETARLASTSTVNNQTGWLVQKSDVPRYIAKIDWNITDNNRLEYTHISDESNVNDQYYGFNYDTKQRGYVQNGGARFKNYSAGVLFLNATGAALAAAQGSNIDILKLTSYVTDDFTVQALIGQAKTQREQNPFGYIPGLRPVVASPDNQVPGVNYQPSQVQGFSSALLRDGAQDTNRGYRLDLEYKLAKQHTIRGGLDHNKINALNGTEAAGGGTWTYLKTNPNTVLSGHNMSPAAGGGYGAQGYYVRENLQRGGSTPTVEQSAQYIEDRYQATENLVVTLGLRNESFKNMNGIGETFVEQKNMLAPRLNAAWNVYGDGSLKVFGTAGRYFMQLPANMAVRFAGASLNTDRFYTYTGVNPTTGAPLGLNPISNVVSANNEFGQEKRANELAATNLKAHFQDEINLGFEKALTPDFNGGIKFTYRKLKNTIDDYSDPRAISAKLTGAEKEYFDDHGWNGALFNPGKDNTFMIPVGPNGAQRAVTITAADAGFPEKAKRTYTALEFMLEHPMRNGWYGKMNYTWSRSEGNQEGQTKSDNGQADVGFSSGWDFPETMVNGSGLLPNNRTHQLKTYGYYEFTSQFGVGGNLLVATGRPMSRTCNIPASMDQQGLGLSQYGSIFFLCPTGPNGRGAYGTLPTEMRLDLNFIYKPEQIKGIVLKVDVLNATNRQVAQSIDEAYNTSAAGTAVSPTAGMVNAYSNPRTVRLSAQYSHKF
ncbi:carboxypeptidase regulatory-like domain-containing protein [Janthinobacterium sp. PLB04]|uniref:TonB-dependent receptor n=1 Tax=Janthinobacterium lividum TaxID=29581 RepID=A0AAJ4MV57_9BURK|nr:MULTISPECIES: carboxypeptidase regulatory-like domain-containing protein [Janthinobacterium]QSX97582.1 TonB-dependent receptor [Janthinobacterium lividum]UGQ37525.1 carboxypeptidase regulatory-like domain-containing protein [Janthinobacterium sp. PLB04]